MKVSVLGGIYGCVVCAGVPLFFAFNNVYDWYFIAKCVWLFFVHAPLLTHWHISIRSVLFEMKWNCICTCEISLIFERSEIGEISQCEISGWFHANFSEILYHPPKWVGSGARIEALVRFPIEGFELFGAVYDLFALSNQNSSMVKNLNDSRWYKIGYDVSRMGVMSLVTKDVDILFYQKRDADQR